MFLKQKNYALIIILFFAAFGVKAQTDTVSKSKALKANEVKSKDIEPRELKEVSIAVKKQVVKQTAGKVTYDVQADPSSKSSNLLEIIPKVPYLSIDGNNNILLKGNTDFKVFINGKPSGMFERNLKEVLRSIPAATIQSIEVMTMPPSKYDAEGAGGIINIITFKKSRDHYSGNINLNQRGPDGGSGAGGSFTFQQGKFGFSSFAGGGIYDHPETQSRNDRTTQIGNSEHLTQLLRNKSTSKSGYFGSVLSYELDSLQLISGRLNLNGEKSNGTGQLMSGLKGNDGSIIQEYALSNENRNKGNALDAAVDYQLAAKTDKNRIFTFSYGYSKSNNDPSGSAAITSRINYSSPDYRQYNEARFSEHTLQADYIYPGKKLTSEFGVKSVFRNNKSDFQYQSLNVDNGLFEVDPGYTNSFNYHQKVLSAYNSYQYNLNSWNFQAGLRLEQTLINADFSGVPVEVKQNYTNVFPSLKANKAFQNGSSINFGFTQRMKRPGINRLNPFVDRINPDFETSGNPHLRPTVVNSFSLGYNVSGKITFNSGVDYSYVRNADLPLTTFDPLTNVTRKSFENTGRIAGLSYFVYANYPVNSKLNFTFNGNAIYFWLAGGQMQDAIKTELFTYALNFSSAYKFNKSWRANADLNIISRNPTGFQGTSNGLVSSALKIGKSIWKDQLSFSAGIANPFTKFRKSESITKGPDFYQRSDQQLYFRTYSLDISYSFGGLKGDLKKNKRGISNDDLKNSNSM